LADPVGDLYKLYLHGIKNLCLEDGNMEMILDAKKEKKCRPPVTSTFEKERAEQNENY
jgi:hypothetical protein